MLSVSEEFTEQEQADVNKPTAQVLLVLGNYATSAFGASASSSGAASDYPAAGAIDGDRTELNVGPASGADNDIGQSSWRSTVAPDTTPQTLTVDMGSSRAINRIKLYHMASHGISSYKLESSPDNSAWTLIRKTTTQGGDITTTHEVDVIDFDDVTCRYVRLTVTNTVIAADMANVIEVEIYRLLDVTSRVISVKTSRSRDYQLSDSLAATASIMLSNTDRYFSPDYDPTDDEISDGFVNSELKPGLGVIVKYGFDFVGSQEYANSFLGLIDKITVKPGSRSAVIEARDGMKPLFNRIVSTKLKTAQDIGDLVQYMLNLANVSTWESDVDQTGIDIDYFFTFDESIIDTIRQLVEASGDANFYFDENGIATFRSYLNSTAMSHTDTTQSDFEAGTLTNINTTSDPGKISAKWLAIDTFDDGDYTSSPAWAEDVGAYTPTGFSASTGELVYTAPGKIGSSTGFGGPGIGTIRYSDGLLATQLNFTTGTWRFKGKITDANSADGRLKMFFMADHATVQSGASAAIYGHAIYNGAYYVEILRSGTCRIGYVPRFSQVETILVSAAVTINSGTFYSIRVTRTSAGLMTLYIDEVQKAQTTHTSITSSNLFAIHCYDGTTVGTYSTYTIDDVYYSQDVDASDTSYGSVSTFVSQTIDQSASIATEGIFQTTQIVYTGTSLAFYTATSDDGVSWDSYIAVAPGDAIPSTPRRYIRYKVVFQSTAYLTSAVLTDVTVNWTIGSGSVKLPSNISYTFDESLNMDLDRVYADTIAGDSSIINSISVKAQPLVLDGADTDVKWQGTTGTPPVDISAGDPLGITIGQTLTYQIVVDGGMDTSRMSGANPAAAAITFAAGGAGTWVFSSIHPTRPVLVITVTGTGTIINLQVQGKSFASDDTLLEATAEDSDSIEEFGKRQSQISNKYIVGTPIAQQIADRLVDNLAEPTTYTPQIKTRPTFSIQIGDRITLTDAVLGISDDNIVIGVEQMLAANMSGAEVSTTLKLLKIAS